MDNSSICDTDIKLEGRIRVDKKEWDAVTNEDEGEIWGRKVRESKQRGLKIQ